MDDIEGQFYGRLDQLRNAATAAALTGGLGLAGAKFGTTGSLSAYMGFAGGKGKRAGKRNQAEMYEQLQKDQQDRKRVLKDPLFENKGEVKEHVYLRERPVDLPGDGTKALEAPYPEQYYGKSWDVNISKTVVNQGGYQEVAYPYIREGLTAEGQHFLYNQKIVQQSQKRKFNETRMQNTLDYGQRLTGGRDLRFVDRNKSEYLTDQGESYKFIPEDRYTLDYNPATHEIIHIDDTRKPPQDFSKYGVK